MHVFIDEDCTSAFKGKGNVGPLKKLQKHPKYLKAFQALSEQWDVTEALQKELEAFT